MTYLSRAILSALMSLTIAIVLFSAGMPLAASVIGLCAVASLVAIALLPDLDGRPSQMEATAPVPVPMVAVLPDSSDLRFERWIDELHKGYDQLPDWQISQRELPW